MKPNPIARRALSARKPWPLCAAVLVWLAALAPAGCTPESPERRAPPDAAHAAGKAVPPAPGMETLPNERPPAELREPPILRRFDVPLDVSIEYAERLLGDVRDETFGYDESAFYWLASVVSRLPADLMGPDEETTPYEQLLATPSAFRGKPVTITGVYATVSPWNVPVEALAKNLPRLYTVNLKEPPGGPASLIATVVVVDDPRTAFLPGDAVKVKGYFYKVRQYQDFEGMIRVAPMLVARRLEADAGRASRLAGPAADGPLMSLGPYGSVAVFMAAALIILIVALVYVRRMGRRSSDANRPVLPHRIRLHRPDRPGPAAPGRPGGESGGQDDQDRPR